MRARPALENFLLQKKLTPRKLRNLLTLADTADRLATRDYIPPEELSGIVARYGVRPDVSTWGDFFALEVATAHWEKNDSEFEKVCQTVIFDLIAAAMIFTGKDREFIEKTRHDFAAARQKQYELRTGEDWEKLHLGVLLGYYEELGLDSAQLNGDDTVFFEAFSVSLKSA
ncbi:MAG: hypothetical protein N2Z22_04795 [Turneriella sp.]|nr:hypothetical protein [Turneriella sp.]